MGTQQILFITLSIIIVGIAVSVGLYAVKKQAMNVNRSAIISEMNYIASTAIAYYKTPLNQGGGGGEWSSREILYAYINLETTSNGDRLVTENGQIEITIRENGQQLNFLGFGYEIGLDDINAVRARLILNGPQADPTLIFIN
ncbi:hypothetical protein ACFLYK_00505 [Candidatus Cloacimonadota bacterium]